MLLFFQQGHVKFIKSDSKDISNVTKDFYKKKSSFELSNQETWKTYHGLHKNSTTTVFCINDNKCDPGPQNKS